MYESILDSTVFVIVKKVTAFAVSYIKLSKKVDIRPKDISTPQTSFAAKLFEFVIECAHQTL